ncbi:MAG: hypothetical protein IPK60_20835 [Sandaracinaceae bacterium]|nr:hypothetical protein [Sandaracinaceae bacterium]
MATNYAIGVSNLERSLVRTFRDTSVWQELLTDRYFQFVRDPLKNVGFLAMFSSEVDFQVERVEAILRQVEDLQRRVGRQRSAIVVPDTNVLLHYKPLSNINWCDLANTQPVRLVIPLRVIEEIDEKKYTGRGTIADRARQVIKELESSLGAEPTALRENVTLQLLPGLRNRRKLADADTEILDNRLDLAVLASEVFIATGDKGMSIRAEAWGIRHVRLPVELLRSNP